MMASGLAVTGLAFALAACAPSDPLEEIEKLQAQGKIEETIEPLRELLEQNPGDGKLLFIYGRTLSAMGKASLAEWSLREAMKDPEWKVSAGLQLAADAARGRNFPAAIEAATLVLDEVPDSVPALLIRAESYTYSRMFHEEALQDVARIEELEPDSLEAMEPKILALIGLERFDEVKEAMDELGRRIDEGGLQEQMSSWHCTTISIFLWEHGEIDESRKRWNQCLAEYPSDPEVVTKALNFFDGQLEYGRSLEIIQKALELDPDNRAFRVRLSNQLSAFGRRDEAEKVLLEGTESERMALRTASWLDLAKFYQALERWDDAADAVGKAVSIVELMSAPESNLLLEYADALLIAGRYDEATEIAEDMTYRPHREMVLARIAQEQGDLEKALEHFELGFALWPDNPFARFHAAQAAEILGDFDRAVEQYRYSIRIAPGATDARIRVAEIHMAQRHYGEALQLLRIRSDSEPLAPEGELLSLRLWALVGRGADVDRTIDSIRTAAPAYIGRALAAVAQGIHDRAGAEPAHRVLRLDEHFDPANLNYAEALRSIVEYAHEADTGVEEANADLETAFATFPDSPEIREIVARWAELSGRPAPEVEAAFNAVLEVDAENGRALEGLARVAAAEGKHAEALAYFERAAVALAGDPGPGIEAARTLLTLEREKDAEARINTVIEGRPFDSEATELLATILFERGDTSDSTLDFARRAVRFGGDEDALNLLVRIHEARGESDAAQRISERWKAAMSGEGEST